MLQNYGFTTTEVAKRTQNRLSNMGFPVLDQHAVVRGVIWFDAVTCGTFPVTARREGQALIRVTAARIGDTIAYRIT